MDLEQVKNNLKRMVKRADTTGDYDEIEEYIIRIKNTDRTKLSDLASPASGLDKYIRTLIKNHLPQSWFDARTEAQINEGGRKRTRRNRRSRRNRKSRR